MSKTVRLSDETAATVARLESATGLSDVDIVADAIALEARRLELKQEIGRRIDSDDVYVEGEGFFDDLRREHAARFERG